MASKAKVVLRLMGDNLDHELITNALSVQPSEVWKKGERSKKYGAIRKYDCWLYETGYCKTDDINDLLLIIHSNFDGKEKEIKELVDQFEMDVSLDIVIEMTDAETPALYFNKKAIDFLHFIGAEIDIDMYIIENE